MRSSVVLIIILSQSWVFADCLPGDILPNRFIAKMKTTENKVTSLAKKMGWLKKPKKGSSGLALLEIEKSLAELKNDPNILEVEPECAIRLFADDPLYPKQWSLPKISADLFRNTSASDLTDVIVAVPDTGVDLDHEDLKNQLWTNVREIPGNGLDDDGNGCVDDVHGCDLVDRDGDPRPSNDSESYHGTMIAGLIGAGVENGMGMAGVAPNAKIMAIRVFGPEQKPGNGALIQSIYYAVDNGAKIINCSWGRRGTPTPREIEAFNYALSRNVVVIVAAGNDGLNAGGYSPAGIPGVVTVGGTDSNDQLYQQSNWGDVVDIVAPAGFGVKNGEFFDALVSTVPTALGGYGESVGTSLSAALVSGVAAYVLGTFPGLTSNQLVDRLKNSGKTLALQTPDFLHSFSAPRVDLLSALSSNLTMTSPDNTSSEDVSKNSHQSTTAPSAGAGGGCGSINSNQPPKGGSGAVGLVLPFVFYIFLRRRRPQYL